MESQRQNLKCSAEVRDDAELGVSFHSLCALHRCFRKAAGGV